MLNWIKSRLERLASPAWWANALERAGMQGLEAAVAVLVAASTLSDVSWSLLAAYVTGGIVWSLTASFATLPTDGSRSYAVALLFRLARTLAAALAGAFTAAATSEGLFNLFDFDWAGSLNVIGLTVALAFVKSLLPAKAVMPEARTT